MVGTCLLWSHEVGPLRSRALLSHLLFPTKELAVPSFFNPLAFMAFCVLSSGALLWWLLRRSNEGSGGAGMALAWPVMGAGGLLLSHGGALEEVVVAVALLILGGMLQARAALRWTFGERGLPAWSWGVAGLAVVLAGLLALGREGALAWDLMSVHLLALLLAMVCLLLGGLGWWLAPYRLRAWVYWCAVHGAAAITLLTLWMLPSSAWGLAVGPALTLSQALGALAFVLVVPLSGLLMVVARLDGLQRELQSLASRDRLTGAYNRATFDHLVNHALQRARRSSESVGLIVFSVDHLRAHNDRHGRDIGDRILGECCRVAQTRLRASDVLGRMGGDRFGVLLPGASLEGAEQVAEGLRRVLSQAFLGDAQHLLVHFTVSLGVAATGESGEGVEDLYKSADLANYRARHNGGNRVELSERGAFVVSGMSAELSWSD